jgi:pimeloyl-ACP methyl ester carboxylesterase
MGLGCVYMKPTGRLNIAGLNIAIYNGGRQEAALALIFVHGNSSSMCAFHRQFLALGDDLQYFGFDLPGHGASENAGDVELYSLRFCAELLKQMVRRLGSRRVLLVGWSLGGHVVLEVLNDLEMPASAVIVGTPPIRSAEDIGKAFLPSPALALIQKGSVTSDEAETWAKNCTCLGARYPPWLKSDFERTDPAAREGLIRSLVSCPFKNEWDQVSAAKIPVTLVVGADDPFINKDFLEKPPLQNLSEGRIEILPGAGHIAHWDAHVAFNEILAARIEKLRQL